jgi:Tol biopolymer transport system component
MKNKEINFHIYLVILFSVLITGCQHKTMIPYVEATWTPFSSTIQPPTPIPSVTSTSETLTPTSGINYQVTYLATCQQESQCMYAIDVGCLETDYPCMGEPQLLFEIPQMTSGPTPPIASYDWSPNGQLIAVESNGLGGKDDIYIGDWTGQSWNNITHSPDNEGGPVWSPCGMYIVYTVKSGWPENTIRIVRNTSDGQGSLELISNLTSLDFRGIRQIALSSEGEHLAFVHSDDNGYSQVFVVNLDGSGLIQLTSQIEEHFQPDFSPNGQRIVTIRQTDRFSPHDEIILLDINSKDVSQVILKLDSYLYTPAWSPIGDWIAYMADIEGNEDIYIVNEEGTGFMNLTQSSNDEYAPAWRVVSP